jgi:lysyl-tRNA synthetase, class I
MARSSAINAEPTDWVTRAADSAIRHFEDTGGSLVTCASGISPSGPIHLGNLREFLTVHFVAEEVRRRGVPVRHLQSWDDYDRFRKVPHGVDHAWNEHIGRPLSAVPDPWECHTSWAEHFKAPLRSALAEMGCEMVEINQTEMYTSGAYRTQILEVVSRRHEIDDVVGRYRTKAPTELISRAGSDQEAAALADSVALEDTPDDAAEDEAGGPSGLARFPVKPYCRRCSRDTTVITAYDDETTDLSYACTVCDFVGITNLATQDEGKLVWKIDWPMRWAFESVNFEPAGADHSSPGSSFTVGNELVEKIWRRRRPSSFGYSFVGFAGMAKMSSSKGGVPTASDALRVLEAPMLRWLYVRRQPKQSFNVDFGPEVIRLYDEWDALTKKAADPSRRDPQVLAYERAAATSTAGRLPTPSVVAPFRALQSAADITAGDLGQISRIIADLGYPHASVEDLEPRLSRAMNWTVDYVPAADRTVVRESPDVERLARLSEREHGWVSLLVGQLGSTSDLAALTSLVYGVPKLALGLPLDADPTDQVKADQKEFFTLLYHLLIDADRGPRLPTLLLSLGAEKVRALLAV